MKLFYTIKNWFKPVVWFVEVEYSKDGAKYYPNAPKSKSHKGDKLNNQYMQLYMSVRSNAPSFDEIFGEIKKQYPKASNFGIIKMYRLN